MSWTLVIHGGAGRITRETVSAEADERARAGLGTALNAGAAVLAGGGAALDAVEAAVRVLEDDPAFNAGRGAALTRDGTAELDAAICHAGGAGAVAGLTRVRHPVCVARAVMERTPHVMLAGPGADVFAREIGAEAADADWLATPERRAQLAELLAGSGGFDAEMKYGTVGAVARDAAGRLAAATSTGGVTGKRPGRIGDSPLIGAGTWADGTCAVSCTGAGEFFIRSSAAAQVSARLRLAGRTLHESLAATLAEVSALGGTGGLIAVDAAGAPAWRFSTPGMNRGYAMPGARQVALYGDEFTGQAGPAR
jgi:L-asparaginase / beta-aspartyl-peptidase